MSQRTSIGWVRDPRTGRQGHSWNPVRGCSRVSPGCQNCYAERIAARFSQRGSPFRFFADLYQPESKWTGRIELIESKLREPLRRRKPTLYFVNSMSDLFHEALSNSDIDRVFAVMALCPQHLFFVLTKRAKRMWKYCKNTPALPGNVITGNRGRLPLPNVWLGVSVEDNAHRDRLGWLMQTPAALRFMSGEPMLGEVDFSRWSEEGLECTHCNWSGSESQLELCSTGVHRLECSEDSSYVCPECGEECAHTPIDECLGGEAGIRWVICGGETGPGARPMALGWARRLRDDCVAAGVPFFFKHWGEYYGGVERVGRKAAGRLLDGRTWNEMPEVTG